MIVAIKKKHLSETKINNGKHTLQPGPVSMLKLKTHINIFYYVQLNCIKALKTEIEFKKKPSQLGAFSTLQGAMLIRLSFINLIFSSCTAFRCSKTQ